MTLTAGQMCHVADTQRHAMRIRARDHVLRRVEHKALVRHEARTTHAGGGGVGLERVGGERVAP